MKKRCSSLWSRAIRGVVLLAAVTALGGCGGGGNGGGNSVPSPTASASSSYTYVANWGDDDVSAYSIGNNGALSQINCGGGPGCSNSNPANFAAGAQPLSIAVDPVGKYVYVANWGSDDISAYRIGNNGALTQINCGGGTSCDSAGGYNTNFSTGHVPYSIIVDPTGKYVYVANYNSDDVSAYSIGSNGALNPINCTTATGGTGCDSNAGYTANFAAGNAPYAIIADPTGKYVYVANEVSNDISAYSIGSNGALSPIDCATVAGASCDTTAGYTANFAAGLDPISITVTPSGKYVYATNSGSGDISAYTIGNTGALRPINCATVAGASCDTGAGDTANFLAMSGLGAITIDPTGTYAYMTDESVSGVSLYRIGSNGALSQISCTTVGGTSCSSIYDVNFTAGPNPLSVTVDPTGKYAYVANNGSADVSAYTIGNNGALTQINCGGGTSCSTSNGTNFAAGTDPQSITTIDIKN